MVHGCSCAIFMIGKGMLYWHPEHQCEKSVLNSHRNGESANTYRQAVHWENESGSEE